MSAETLRTFLRSTAGKIMTVWFIKRTTGELRQMNCRTEVKKHLAHPEDPVNPVIVAQDKKHDVLRVFDMRKRAYRMINLRTVTRIRCGGKEYTADD